MTPLIVVIVYLCLLLALGLFSGVFFRGTSRDYFVASHSIGPFLLLMSVFGTTMTAFALVGSTGKAFTNGIGVYGLMASSSGLIHAAVFFLIGIRMWSYGKKYGYVTQIQYFRARFESNNIGYLLFPILVGLVVPYLLIGVMGAGKVIQPVTAGAFPDLFPHARFAGGIPPWLTGLVICAVVLIYVFQGGSRGTAWANTFQTLVFMAMGLLAFWLISGQLGGLAAATQQVMDKSPQHLSREGMISPAQFASYMLIPLSVGMFPHLFQHWLTAKSAKTFRLTVIAHPLFIMIVWVPCVLIGVWAVGAGIEAPPNAVLGATVARLIKSPLISGLVTAGILAAIMSSLDSQFLCLGTIFTNDIVLFRKGKDHYSDKQIILIARAFIIAIVTVTYGLAMLANRYDIPIFDLAVWCFSGFSSLFPLVFAAVYWRRVTKWGAYASIISAMVVWLYFFQQSGWGGEYTVLGGVMPVTFSFAAGVVALVVVSLATKPPSEATLAKFFPDRATSEPAAEPEAAPAS